MGVGAGVLLVRSLEDGDTLVKVKNLLLIAWVYVYIMRSKRVSPLQKDRNLGWIAWKTSVVPCTSGIRVCKVH
jgi:hypothetical protein